MKDGLFPPWDVPSNMCIRQEFVLFPEKQMLSTQVMYALGLIFKARKVIIPFYTSFANLTFGSTVQSFLLFVYKRNSNIDKLQGTYKWQKQ